MAAPSSPPRDPTYPSSPPRDPTEQPIWSPDTPEYIPQYTCRYIDEQDVREVGEAQIETDDKGLQEAHGMQIDTDEKVEQYAADPPTAHQSSKASASNAYKQIAYGSGSVAPFARHKTGN